MLGMRKKPDYTAVISVLYKGLGWLRYRNDFSNAIRTGEVGGMFFWIILFASNIVLFVLGSFSPYPVRLYFAMKNLLYTISQHLERESGTKCAVNHFKVVYAKKRTWALNTKNNRYQTYIRQRVWRSRQSVGLGIERSRVRNSLLPLRKEIKSALLGGPVRWECSLGRALTTVRPQGAPHSTQV